MSGFGEDLEESSCMYYVPEVGPWQSLFFNKVAGLRHGVFLIFFIFLLFISDHQYYQCWLSDPHTVECLKFSLYAQRNCLVFQIFHHYLKWSHLLQSTSQQDSIVADSFICKEWIYKFPKCLIIRNLLMVTFVMIIQLSFSY